MEGTVHVLSWTHCVHVRVTGTGFVDMSHLRSGGVRSLSRRACPPVSSVDNYCNDVGHWELG